MKKRKKKNKKTIKVINTFKYIFIVIIFFIISFFTYIAINAPEFNEELLYKTESTNIYDNKGDLITTIGNEKRIIAEYNELPEVLKDAIISVEDARFYEHNGLDIPRFLKASVSYLLGNNIGGASTLTMQISKNTYTDTTASGIKGIMRKFTDIYISIFKIEKNYSKDKILEFYVNAPYLGASSYGVEMASKTYFNKDVYDLNLIEASFLAGMFQAPSEYDPYINIDNANKRKNEVLSLMLRHGYITNTEYEIAKNENIENYIVKNNNNISEYQGFIDTVVEEVINKEKINPYEVSMDIYTTMSKEKQDVINNFYKKHKFKDNKVQVGVAVIDNDTGGILAVGAGRNKNSILTFNYATQIKRHPGSTAKPIFDYGPGIEYLNWSTYTPFYDKPVKYTNGGYMHNVDNKYQGFLTLEQCLVRSRNTCALQAFKLINKKKLNTFVTSLGIEPEYLYDNYINEAHSIGAFTGVSPVELASAYSSFANGGYHTEEHCVNKIILKENNKEKIINYDYEKTKVMKDTTAYLINHMLQKATPYNIKVKGTQLASKTGTSSYDEDALKKLGLTTNVIQDSWTVTYSKDYTVSIWYGYDKLTKKYYNTTSHSFSERRKLQKEIVTKIMEKNTRFDIPNNVIALKVETGSKMPYLVSSNTPKSKIQTHLFIKGYEPTTYKTYTIKENEIKEDTFNNDLLNILEP